MKAAHNEHMFIDIIDAGYLKIDEEGRVWRIARRYKGKKYPVAFSQELKYVGGGKYNQLHLRKNGKEYNCYVHRLVWLYFNGDIPDNLEMNHKNGIKTDNRLENLELVTSTENKKHAYKIGLMRSRKGQKHLLVQGEKNGRAKLTDNSVREIRLRYQNGEKLKLIALDFNISSSLVSYICNRKIWAHVK